MKKRFTDTNKWDQPWFRKLTPDAKLLWFFLCDRCDAAGVWETDEDAFRFFSGSRTTFSDLLDELAERVENIGDKLHVVKFVSFQYGAISPTNNAHRAVLATAERHGLSVATATTGQPQGRGKPDPSQTQARPKRGADQPQGRGRPAPMDKDMDMDKDKEREKEKDKDRKTGLLAWAAGYWNEKLGHKLPKVRDCSPDRAAALAARLNGSPDPEARFKEVLGVVQKSPHLLGETNGDRSWRADFDWLLKPKNWRKVTEGAYLPPVGAGVTTKEEHERGF